jgi:hypothetical protein
MHTFPNNIFLTSAENTRKRKKDNASYLDLIG